MLAENFETNRIEKIEKNFKNNNFHQIRGIFEGKKDENEIFTHDGVKRLHVPFLPRF